MATTLQIALIKMLKTPSGPSLRLRSVAEVAQHAWGPGDSQRAGWIRSPSSLSSPEPYLQPRTWPRSTPSYRRRD